MIDRFSINYREEVMRVQERKNKREDDSEERIDIVHLGRGRRPYRVERGEHGEFKDIKGPAEDEDMLEENMHY
jgi:hypothetical protein